MTDSIVIDRICATSERMLWECAPLQRIVLRDRDSMHGRPLIPQPDVASLFADDLIAEALQCVDETIGRYAARRSHAASTGINSSFT